MVVELAKRFEAELKRRKLPFSVPVRGGYRAEFKIQKPYNLKLHELATRLAREREDEMARREPGAGVILVGTSKGKKEHRIWFTMEQKESRSEWGLLDVPADIRMKIEKSRRGEG